MSPARRKGFVLRYRLPHGAVSDGTDDPYGIAARIGRYSAGWRWPTALAATVAVHVGLTVLAYLGDREHREIAPPPQQVVTLERPPPPAPVEPPPPEPPKPVPHRAPPPAAAQSAKVVTAAPDPSEPLDLTSFSMPEGKSDAYAGGLSAASGTSTVAVTDPRASARGVVGGTGNTPGGSLARAATPARRDWSCTWPEEEQSGDLHDARVTVRVKVSEEGRAEAVDVLSSPKDSFAQAARACARTEPFRPARNDAGHEIAGFTSPFAVHFVR